MAHLWIRRDPTLDGGADWALLPLTDAAIDVAVHPPRTVDGLDDDDGSPATRATLAREPGAGRSGWVLIAGASTRVAVNGGPLRTGLRVLEDRDEIRVDGVGSMFLSTETPPRVEPCPDADAGKFCPRCKLALEAGSPSVACPGCDVRYHQSEEYPCWTYAETCALCSQPTALDGSLRWTPETFG